MREIKFRAWDSKRNKFIERERLFIQKYDGRITTLIHGEQVHLMQFTGLKDKNGREIFEGDIVKVDFDGEDQTIHTVIYGDKYDYPAFDLDPDLDCDCNSLQHCVCSGSTTVEIIGNIWENKELLNDSK